MKSSRLELRNSLFYHHINTVGIKVSSLSFALKCKHIQKMFEVFYPDLDTGASGGTQPVAVGAEAKSIDGVTTVQGVEVLALIQVPKHGLAILKERKRALRTIFRISLFLGICFTPNGIEPNTSTFCSIQSSF